MATALQITFHNVKFRYEDDKKTKKGGKLSVVDTSVIYEDIAGGKVTIAAENIDKQMVSVKPGSSVVQIVTKSTEKYKFTMASDKERDAFKDIVQSFILNNQRAALTDTVDDKPKDTQVAASSTLSTSEFNQLKKKKEEELLQAKALANPELKESYIELTQTKKLLTHDEFWQGHKAELEKYRKVDVEESNPQIGVCSDVISTFKPQQSRNNEEMKYNINPDSIKQIFALYPKLATEYNKMVPIQCSEQEFWERVVKSQLFHRGSRVEADAPSVTELFPGLRQERGVSSNYTGIVTPSSWMPDFKRKRNAFDPRYDLDASEEQPNSDDESNLEARGRAQYARARVAKAAKLSLINQDSAGILNTMTVGPQTIASKNHNAILAQSTDLDDLKKKAEHVHTPLAFDPMILGKADNAKTMTTTITNDDDDDDDHDDDSADDGDTERSLRVVLGNRTSAMSLDPAKLAIGGAKYVERISHKYLCPQYETILDETAAEAVVRYDEAISGVLRHYWGCFSPTIPLARVKQTTILGKRAVKMADALRDTLSEKLPNLVEQQLGDENEDMLDNLKERVEKALSHFDSWQLKLSRLAKVMAQSQKKKK
eukprot:m.202116 g.202116  ORF g.202116 m.202116 type:complete len:599 (+) comp32817_c0_seq2:155-1951(+)